MEITAPPSDQTLLRLVGVVESQAFIKRRRKLVPQDDGPRAAREEGIHLGRLDNTSLDSLKEGGGISFREVMLIIPHSTDQFPQLFPPFGSRAETMLLLQNHHCVHCLPQPMASDGLRILRTACHQSHQLRFFLVSEGVERKVTNWLVLHEVPSHDDVVTGHEVRSPYTALFARSIDVLHDQSVFSMPRCQIEILLNYESIYKEKVSGCDTNCCNTNSYVISLKPNFLGHEHQPSRNEYTVVGMFPLSLSDHYNSKQTSGTIHLL
jgi:hypothetical protein